MQEAEVEAVSNGTQKQEPTGQRTLFSLSSTLQSVLHITVSLPRRPI